MVAYGVLEMKHKSPGDFWLEGDNAEQIKQDDFERDQLRKLVNDELARYGLLLKREITPSGNRFRTRANTHVLYGQPVGKPGFMTREILCVGGFRECCIEAASLLDKLDASQIPDTET